MTQEKGEMLKTGYLEVVHDQEMQLVIGEVSDDDFMTREKGEMLKTEYLEVVHAATAGVIPLNEDEEHGVDPEENFLWGMQHS